MQSLLGDAARGAGISGGGAALASMVVNAVTALRTPNPPSAPSSGCPIEPPGERRMRPRHITKRADPWATRIPHRGGGLDLPNQAISSQEGVRAESCNPTGSAEFSEISANGPNGMSGMGEK